VNEYINVGISGKIIPYNFRRGVEDHTRRAYRYRSIQKQDRAQISVTGRRLMQFLYTFNIVDRTESTCVRRVALMRNVLSSVMSSSG